MTLSLGRWLLDIGWLFFLIILLIHFWRKRKILVMAKSWLKTKGRVTHFEWVEADHGVWPKIEYSYQVYEKDLTGEYLFLDTSHNNPYSKYSRLIAYKAAIAYKENTNIDVYYNPNDPNQSALDVTIPLKLNIILILIASLLCIHGGVILFHLWG